MPAFRDAIRVIVLDGVGASRQRLGRLLAAAEEVEVAALARSGTECLALAGLLGPEVIVVAPTGSDDSLQLIALLRKNLPRAGLVLVAPSSDIDYLRRAMAAGARQVLPLPPKGEQLLAAVRAAAA